MARDNSITQSDNHDDEYHSESNFECPLYETTEKSPDSDWRHEKTKRRRSTLAQEDHDNSAAWRIDNLNRLMTEMDRVPDGVLPMILDMRKTYMEYFDHANEADKQHDAIRTRALGLEQDLHISNVEREEAVTLLQKQAKKLKQYEKIIDNLQNATSVTPDTSLASVEQSTNQRHSVFTHALSAQANNSIPSRQPTIRTTHTGSETCANANGKLTKALPDPPIFTDKQDSSIDQWLSKM